jgi:chromatin segregation and condensation protein Rec8/ScpA/Scc1 (kleisin family)
MDLIKKSVKLTEAELIWASRARADMIRRRRAAMMADERAKKWAKLTPAERAKRVIDLMTKNHMEHARLLGKHQSEEALREKLIQCAMRHDILNRKEIR